MNAAEALAQWFRNSTLAERGGWTLLHSIWELAAVAGLLAVVLRFLGGASARARYLVSTAAMALMFALPLATFLVVANSPLPAPGFPASRPSAPAPAAIGAPKPVDDTLSEDLPSAAPAERPFSIPVPAFLEGAFGPSWTARLAERFTPAVPWLTLVWTIGVAVLSISNLGGWVAIKRLRSLGVSPVDPELAGRFSRLSAQLFLTCPVRVARSTLIQIPVVIGFLSPLVLIPVSVVAGLPPAYLDAILAHELAHIRRHDHLVNLFQVLAETLLFYHPATWWVSRRIREERENCCDDIAARVCGDSRLYAKALVCVEDLRPSATSLALAATGGGPMFRRIQRLLGLRPNLRPRRTASLAVVALSLAALLLPLGCNYVVPPPSGVALQIPDQELFQNNSATGDFFKSLAGLQTFDGLPFDIKGSSTFYGLAGATGRKSLEGIQVGRPFDELHLIHYVKYAADRGGTPVARFRLNYADGSDFEFQILYGAQVRTYCKTAIEDDDRPTDPSSKVIWRSPHDEGSEVVTSRLFETVLPNPFPAKVVQSLDVYSGIGRSCYCLVAATVAKADPNRPVTAAVPPRWAPEAARKGRTGILTVRVLDRASHAPVADALVVASMFSGGSTEIVIPTDATGTASVKYPMNPEGQLEVAIIKDGYGMKSASWLRGQGGIDFVAELDKGASIGGLVLSEGGKAVSSALMHLHQLDQDGDEYRTEISARSDRNGRWSMSGIAANDRNFSISVGHSGFATMKFLPDGGPQINEPSQYVSPEALFSGKAVLRLAALDNPSIAPDLSSTASTGDKVAALRKEVDQARAGNRTDSTAQEQQAASAKTVREDVPRILDLIDADPSFDAMETLQWIVEKRLLDTETPENPPLWERPRLVALLQGRFVKDPRIAKICWVIGRNWSPSEAASAALFEAVAKQNPDRRARAYATFAAACFFRRQAAIAETQESLPDEFRFGQEQAPAARVRYADLEAAGGSKALYAQAAERLRVLGDRYPDVPGGATDSARCGEIARLQLDEIEHFTVGARPPEIAGVNLRGQPLKLSDYRGKCVVLFFWGSWSEPAMQTAAIQRHLAERMAGKPVALIGVNSDEDISKGLAAAVKEGMTWASFWNGSLGPDGPIAKDWHVRIWPAVFILNGDGVICFKFSGHAGDEAGPILEAIVERVLASNRS
jgi:beta-lactamase regulating signal transducer with metallopeptidase domain